MTEQKTKNSAGERLARGWTVTIIHSPGRGAKSRTYRLSDPLIVLGREPRGEHAAIRIDDPAVSRSGVVLRLVSEQYEIWDEGSHNPVRVNGVAVQKRPLLANDVIRLGDSLLVIDRDDPARQSRPRSASMAERRVDGLLEKLCLGQSTAAALVALEASLLEPDLRSVVLWTPGVLESRYAAEWLAACWDQPLHIVDANAEGAVEEIRDCPASTVLLVDRLDLASAGQIPRLAREVERRSRSDEGALTITSVDRRYRHDPTPVLEQAVALICAFDLTIPPLHERRADVLFALTQNIGIELPEGPGSPIDADVAEYFVLYNWPLGLSELQRHAFHVRALLRRGETGLGLVPNTIRDHVRIDMSDPGQPLSAERVRDALAEFGSMREVAAYFGYSRTYFYRLLQRQGIDVQALRIDARQLDEDDHA